MGVSVVSWFWGAQQMFWAPHLGLRRLCFVRTWKLCTRHTRDVSQNSPELRQQPQRNAADQYHKQKSREANAIEKNKEL